MEITAQFEKLGFHDSTIDAVSREDGVIEILFEFVVVSGSHPQGNGKLVELRNARLRFTGVRSETALIWHDDKAPLPHPSPEHPVREVMHGDVGDRGFHFDGFWNPDDWSEWYIVADAFVLTGKEDASDGF